MALTPHQKRLAQHLFLHIDTTLKGLEAKRSEKGGSNGTAMVWNNVNMAKLALDAVHRIDLGLDALIPNHISPIPYYNKTLQKYDLDLRVGYVGKDLYRRKFATEEPLNIIYELVYSTDKFKPLKRGPNNETETYEFEITNPFERGDVVGGFGYIMYADPQKNKLVLVSEKDFQRSRACARSKDFWDKNPVEMRFKTLVHRVTDKLPLDPRKISDSFTAVEGADNGEMAVDAEVAAEANQQPLDIDTETGEVKNETPQTAETTEPAQSEGDNGEPKTKEPGF
jgi:recombination protein RecT